MPGPYGPSTTGNSGRELLSTGALVLLLGIAFVTFLFEPTQASVPQGIERIAAATVLEIPDDRPARPAGDRGLVPARSDTAAEAAAPAEAAAIPPARAVVAVTAPLALDGMRVHVARLGIDLPLRPGNTARDTVLRSTPNGGAFLLPSSVPPGSGGNSYIYAHARAGMFLSLWNVRLGDVVEVTSRSSETRRYRVTEIHPRVAPTDFQYTLPTADERITLQTSTGPHDADPRFVVVATRAD
jgi:sortase family protein